MAYTFTLIFQINSAGSDVDALVERLGEVGCDDALVGIGQPGRIALEFIRDASNAREAMESALGDVLRAIPTATLIEAAPDLVGITDVAEITGVSRQNIRKLLISRSATAPLPVHAGNPSLWHLSDMLSWLEAELHYEVPLRTLEIALVAAKINIRKEAARLRRDDDRCLAGLARGEQAAAEGRLVSHAEATAQLKRWLV